jgi:hypothetical protein
MMDEQDTHRLGFKIRAQIGRVLASCLDAWDHVRPPKDDYERWLIALGQPRSEAHVNVRGQEHRLREAIDPVSGRPTG